MSKDFDGARRYVRSRAKRPAPYTMAWPDPDHGPFRLRVWLEQVDGRPAIVGLEMWGREPVSAKWAEMPGLPDAKRIGAGDLRLVPLGHILDEATAKPTAEVAVEPRPSRSRLGDEHYRQVADLYRQIVHAGGRESRSPAVAIAQRFAVAPTTARTWIRRATAAGLLPPATSGTVRGLEEDS